MKMKEIVRCECGKVWFKDSIYAYSETIYHAPALPPEGLATERKYYCEDCFPF